MSETRVVVVTGSTSGIGKAIAERCLASGWSVVVNSRADAGRHAAFLDANPEAVYVRGDIADASDCERIVASALDRWGRLDALVNNAGTTQFIPHADIAAVTADVWHKILDVNIIGTWQMISAALEHLREASGSIVNMASVAGLRPAGSSLPYAVSKAGLIHMTTLLAKALGPAVRVNAIAPGMIETPWTEEWSDARNFIESNTPLRRTGTPDEVAQLCEWLLNATYTTGECVSVDGGMRLAL